MRGVPMLWAWRRKGSAKRPTGGLLRAEPLETRDTPAGLFAAAVAAGNAPVVSVYDASTGAPKFTITAYDTSFTGGVNVAVGDVDGDGTPEVITAAAAGGGPVVKVFSGTDGSLLKTFTVGDPDSRAGASVAAADFDHDGKAELVVGSMQGGAPLVEVLRYSDGTAAKTFTPFAGAQAVSVAAGDFNGDGTPDVVAGAGAGGGPRVTVFDGSTGAVLLDTFAFELTFHGGVGVSAGDLNGDGKADVVVGAGSTGGPRVTVLSGGTGATFQNFFPYDPAGRLGVVASAFASPSGAMQIATALPGQGGVEVWDGRTLAAGVAPAAAGVPVGPTVVAATASTPSDGGSTATSPPPVSPPPTTPPLDTTTDSGMTNTLPPLDSPNWVTKPDGLKIWDVQTGSGTAVTSGSTVNAFYTGWLTNGTVFDSARTSPATFPLANVIQGWQEGLVGMQPGGIRRLYIPAALGYGAGGAGSIPPNSDLVFEVKLASTT